MMQWPFETEMTWFTLIVATTLCGCYSQKGGHANCVSTRYLEYSEAEIRSKSWTNSMNHCINFLGWSEVEIGQAALGTKLGIAKYGYKEKGLVTSLDFYIVEQRHLVLHDKKWTAYVLIAHDDSSSVITALRQEYDANGLGIHVVREPWSEGAKGPVRQHHYWLYYSPPYQIWHGMHDRLTERDTNDSPGFVFFTVSGKPIVDLLTNTNTLKPVGNQ
ncbi:MAG: hypothetical protein WCO56_02395 [Verrucomicrobiota bacterium]